MPFKHYLVDHRFSDNLIVKITTRQNKIGFGEGVPRDFVTGEKLSQSVAYLEDRLWSQLVGLSIEQPSDTINVLSEFFTTDKTDQAPALCCALEMAILDAAGKIWSIPVANFFGAKDQPLHYSAVFPMTNLDAFNNLLCLARDADMTQVKVKVGDDLDLARLAAARSVLGPGVDIRVDANGAWQKDEAIQRITEMMAYGISAVEQPVEKTDFSGFRKVAETSPIPLIADESLCSEKDAQKLAAMGSNIMFNLRLSKCGGMIAVDRLHAWGCLQGVPSQLGCQVGETSILAAAGQQFAITHPLRYLEGAYSTFLLKEDIVDPPLSFGRAGKAEPSLLPGLGIVVNESSLERLAVMHRVISSPLQ